MEITIQQRNVGLRRQKKQMAEHIFKKRLMESVCCSFWNQEIRGDYSLLESREDDSHY